MDGAWPVKRGAAVAASGKVAAGRPTAASGEAQRVHVEDDGDVFGHRVAGEDLLDVAGEGAWLGPAQGELEAELAVGLDQRARAAVRRG